MYARIGNSYMIMHAVVIFGRIKLFVIAVEKPTAGRLQQLQRGGRLVGLNYPSHLKKKFFNCAFVKNIQILSC